MTVEETAPRGRAGERMVAPERLPQALPQDQRPPPNGRLDRRSVSQGTIAVGFAVLLLVLATTSDGAFTISRWAPLALFVLAVLVGALIVPARKVLPASRPARVAIASIWGLALWSLLSMLWAKSSGSAFQAADRMILYAAIVSLPFALPISRSSLAAVGWAVSAGIGAIAVYVLIRLGVNGVPLMLAGRLNSPIGYRNATALLFALPVWPFIIFAATRTNRRPLRAAAFALAVLCLGLVFLTQSRGILIGLVLGACVALSAGPDRVRRAWIGILAVGAVALGAPWLLKPYHAFTGDHFAAIPHDVAVAAAALAFLTAGAFVVGMLLALFDQGLRADSSQMKEARRLARVALAFVVVIGLVGVLVAVGNPVTFARSKWNEFHQLNASTTASSTRLLTVGGQRYDLWRVAMKEFSSAPVLGVGADNYSFGYYRDRATNRNLTDPHSLLFSLLAELGIVGTALFATFVLALVAAIRRGWPGLSSAQRRAVIASASGGAVMLGQSLVDWMWLIPGITAIGLFMLAVAAAQAGGGGSRLEARVPRRTRWMRFAAAGGLVAAMVGVLALFLSDAYIQRARDMIYNPPAELAAAKVASTFDPWSVDPHYLESSAYETMGNRPAAFAQLRDALSLEPQNPATLGVLGDFEARAGNLPAARDFYRRALALDPLDSGLQQLARLGDTARPATHAAKRHR